MGSSNCQGLKIILKPVIIKTIILTAGISSPEAWLSGFNAPNGALNGCTLLFAQSGDVAEWSKAAPC